MEVKRGDIWFYTYEKARESIQQGRRPCVIVSNDVGNYFSNIVTVVPLTTAQKKPLPTHVQLFALERSTALCEQVITIPKECLTEMVASAEDCTMRKINRGMMIALGIIE